MSSLRLFAFGAIACAATLPACGNALNESHEDDLLDHQVCTQADVGERFNQQTSGDFSPGNLADLTGDARARLAEYRAGGMVRGHFVYWKEIASRPPFDPPLDVVCQAMEFETSEQARVFVTRLTPETAASALIGWLPGDPIVAAAPAAPLGDAARGFELLVSSESGPVSIGSVVVATGKYVRFISVGGPGTVPSSDHAMALQETIAGRAD